MKGLPHFIFGLLLAGCAGDKAADSGPSSSDGADGTDGTDGPDGTDGGDGADGSAQDADGDGYPANNGDCDDSDPAIHPGQPEACDGVDTDCDGQIGPGETDADGDGALDCQDCVTGGWWPQASVGLAGADLAALLQAGMAGRVCSTYDLARDALFQIDATDGVVTCVYTGQTFDLSGGVDFDIVNTEHAWPRSDGAEAEPEECDLHHLFVTEAVANGRRGNYPFGEVLSESWSGGGSRLGTDASGETVFEPRSASRGDIARAMLYFDLKYAGTLDPAAREKQASAARRALFSRWHAEDPPSADERRRNLARDAAQAGGANPLVVCPWLVEDLGD